MNARLLLSCLVLVGIGTLLATPARATCVANPAPSLRDLAWCLRGSDPDVMLKEGEHRVLEADIPAGFTLRADPAAADRPVVRTRSPSFELLRLFVLNPEPAWLSDSFSTFIVKGSSTDAPVTVKGLRFAPLAADLTVLGAGRVNVGRVFWVEDGVLEIEDCVLGAFDYFPDDADDTPQDITLRGDLAEASKPDDQGGVLAFVSGRSELKLDRVEVGDVFGPGVRGAAVFATGADSLVEVIGGTFRDSVIGGGMLAADDGASLYVLDDSGIPAATFRGLSAVLGGGVLADQGGVVELYGGVYRTNGSPAGGQARRNIGAHAAADRGGILRIHGGDFADGSAAWGGVAAARNAQLEVYSGARFGSNGTGNTARVGGLFALWRDDRQPGPAPTGLIVGAELAWASAGRNGAEDDLYEAEPLPGQSPTSDWATGGGAIAISRGILSLEDVVLHDNLARAGAGGAILAGDSTVTVSGGELRDNGALFGGAVFLQGGSLTVSGGRIFENGLAGLGTEAGGGISARDADVTLQDDLQLSANRAIAGGGLAVSGEGRVALNQTRVISNVAEIGGGIAAGVTDLTIFGGSLIGNTAVQGGGGLVVSTAESADGTPLRTVASVTEVEVRGNSGGNGGGIASIGVDLTLEASILSENQADGVGGGIYAEGRTLTVRRTELRSNVADLDGGGLYLAGSVLELVRSELIGNQARRGSALVAGQAGGHLLAANRVCANPASEQSQIVLSAAGSPGAEPSQLVHNLIDGALDGAHELVLVEGEYGLANNHVVRAEGVAISAVGASLRLSGNVVAYGVGEGPVLGVLDSDLGGGSGNVLWGPRSALSEVAAQLTVLDDELLGVTGSPVSVPDSVYELADPRLRGWIDVPPVDGCAWALHHPRPDSPLLTRYERGMAFDPSEAHGGLWGGSSADLHPTDAWETSLDGDQDPRIFDCNDRDVDVGDRLGQFVDGDQDGVGGAEWPGYECTLQPGNTEVGGDCDDEDAAVQACPDLVTFYGSRCSTVPLRSTLAPGLLLTLLVFRRRRRHPSAATL